jgi:AcrR family transcriptional regulator
MVIMDNDHLVIEPKTKRGQATLDKICKSAEKLFYEKGYYNTSIADIAEGAKVAPSTVYLYFTEKISIFRYILLDFGHEIRKSISLAVKDCKTRYEKEYHGMKSYIEFIKKRKSVYYILWESLSVDFGLFEEYYEHFANYYIQALAQAKEEGEVNNDLEETSTAYSLMGISTFIGLKYVIFENKLPEEEIIKSVMRIMHHGIFKHV